MISLTTKEFYFDLKTMNNYSGTGNKTKVMRSVFTILKTQAVKLPIKRTQQTALKPQLTTKQNEHVNRETIINFDLRDHKSRPSSLLPETETLIQSWSV